jgi:hypothetical protein
MFRRKLMNRRNLMKAMLTLPVAGALGGCREKPEGGSSSPASQGTLRIVLHGPFALVLNRTKPSRIKAFVPFDAEKERQHLFSYPTPKDVVGKESDHSSFHFELSTDGLEVNQRLPYVDHGFDDFKIHTGEFEPMPKAYFVTIDLPAPEVITFPTGEYAFVNVRFVTGKTAAMPLNQVLEYRVRDLGKVRIESKELGSLPALSYSDVRQKYQQADQKKMTSPHGSVRHEYMGGTDTDIRTYFFGVGLPSETPETVQAEHAIRFFNNRLLASFPNSPDAATRRLAAVGVSLCQTTRSDSSGVVPAALTYPMPEPRLRMVTATDDCRLGGLIGSTP